MFELSFSHPTSDQVVEDQQRPVPRPAAPEQSASENGGMPLFSHQDKKALPEGTAEHELPANIAELRKADTDRRMYSAQTTYADVVKDFDGATEQERQFLAEAREQLADVGASSIEAREIAKVFNESLRDGLPTEATVAAWQREAQQEVARLYGRHGPARLEEARRLIARDPRVHAMLASTGLGNHPRIVALAISLARSERGRGRL